MNITSILGSPSAVSRSAALLQVAQARLGASASQIETVSVRDLPCQAMLHAQFADAGIQDAIRKVRQAQVVLVATPIYKAACSGLLKHDEALAAAERDALLDRARAAVAPQAPWPGPTVRFAV